MNASTEQFIKARNFLLENRNDYIKAYAGFNAKGERGANEFWIEDFKN